MKVQRIAWLANKDKRELLVFECESSKATVRAFEVDRSELQELAVACKECHSLASEPQAEQLENTRIL